MDYSLGDLHDVDQNLVASASSPDTDPEELRRLAAEYPNLRPLIAMNAAAYPGLLQWLADIGDPAINLALQQRRAAEETAAGTGVGNGPQRVSVMHGAALASGAPTPHPTIVPSYAPVRSDSATPATPKPSASSTQAHEQKVAPWIVVFSAILLIAAILLALWFFFLKGDNPQDLGAPPATDQQTQTENQSEEQATSPKEQAPKVIVYPAPSSAIEAPLVRSPSGNIVCSLSDHGAACTIKDHDLASGSLATCKGQPVTLMTSENGDATIDCTTPPVDGNESAELAYGDYAKSGFGACYSTENGMSCWNTATGSSFAVARAGYVLRGHGKIEQNDFPWN